MQNNNKSAIIQTVFAPAKINLYLHVTGRREDGYHLLDSLVVFADTGDIVSLAPANDFHFEMDGPYARAFALKETDNSPDSANLAVRAAWDSARIAGKPLNVRLKLTKNLPLAAGMGGGSADAAAVVWGLLRMWGLEDEGAAFQVLKNLGADAPVCYACRPAVLSGAGDKFHPVDLPEMPAVLVNPGIFCATGAVFKNFAGPLKAPVDGPPAWTNRGDLVEFLRRQDNVLSESARGLVPVVDNVLHALNMSDTCELARMSGSGATCFGLFPSSKDAEKAALRIREDNPDWWVRETTLNRPDRY